MDVHLSTVLGLGIVLVLMIGLALWFFAVIEREDEKRRKDLKSNRLSHQPWDSADGRANR